MSVAISLPLPPSLPPSRTHTPFSASRGAATGAACIDHKYYPDIMDAVFSSVCPRGSLVLRATSREWRDRVDNELWRHIALAPSDRGMGISVAAAGGGMPLRVRHCGHTCHGGDCTTIAREHEADDGEVGCGGDDVFPGVLKYARVVSIRGPVDAYAGSLAWFSGKLKQIETLRLLPPMPRPQPFMIWPDTVRGARTVIVFTEMQRGSRGRAPFGGSAEIYRPPIAPIPPVTASATRLVLNITFHPDDPFVGESRMAAVGISHKLAELVLIFRAAPPADVVPDLGRPSAHAHILRRPPLGILNPTVNGMLGNARLKVTVVDAAAMGNRALGVPEDVAPRDVYEKLLETAAEIFLTQGVGFDAKDPTKNLRFLSLEEYRQTIDDDEFEMETRE